MPPRYNSWRKERKETLSSKTKRKGAKRSLLMFPNIHSPSIPMRSTGTHQLVLVLYRGKYTLRIGFGLVMFQVEQQCKFPEATKHIQFSSAHYKKLLVLDMLHTFIKKLPMTVLEMTICKINKNKTDYCLLRKTKLQFDSGLNIIVHTFPVFSPDKNKSWLAINIFQCLETFYF